MKFIKIASCVLFLMNITFGYSQQSFIWNFPNYQYSHVLETTPGQYYFVGGFRNKQYSSLSDSAIILKWSNNGDSVTKIITKDTQYNSMRFYWAIPHSKNGFIAIGFLGYRNNRDSNEFWMVRYDSLLNQLWETKLPLARRGPFITDVKKLKNGNWLVALNASNMNWLINDQYFLIEVTENGQIEHVIPSETFGDIFSLAIHPVTGNIYCLGDYPAPNTSSQNWLKIYDTAYNILGYKPIFPHNAQYSTSGPYGGEWMSADTLLLSARKDYRQSTIQDEDVCLYYMKESDSILPIKEKCFRRPNTIDYTVTKSYDITADKKIIQVGDLDCLNWEKNWIGCYDKQFNLLYHRIITSSEWRNSPNKIFSTSDSGFIITNYVYKTMANRDSTYLQILKFDKNGNLPGLGIEQKVRIERHLLYPNPGKDYFMLELSRELLDKGVCVLELYATNGRLQQQWTFEGNQAQIITQSLPAGLYFYRVLQNNKLVVSGKWLKQ